jgi:Cu-processing system permease protein
MTRLFTTRRPPGTVSTACTLARREVRDAVLGRWFALYSLALAGLGLCVSYVSATSLGGAGLAGFGRTSAGLINLVLLVVPLMALTAGAASIAGDRERGTLSFLLAQPARRWEVLMAKFVGLAIALTLSLCLGFGASALVLAMQGSNAQPGPFVKLVAFADLLALAMLAVGMLISVNCRRSSVATGVAIFVWLVLVFGTDLGLMAGTLASDLSIEWLFRLAVASPLQAFKMWALQSVDASLDVLGPAGLYAQTEYGPGLQFAFAGVLLVWTVLPLVASVTIFNRRSAL